MIIYIFKRIGALIPTVLILMTLSFFLMHLAPGGPFTSEKNLPPEIQKNIAKQYHLDEPVWKQYLRYLNNTARGDLGPSFKNRDWTVNQLIAKAFPVSLRLGAWAILLAVVLGVTVGATAALYQHSWVDAFTSGFAMFVISIPSFVIAPLMVFVFAVILHWLPAAEWGNGAWNHLLMPVIALALPQMAIIARLMRGSMIEVLGSPYIRTARAKGLPERAVVLHHALRPAFMPVLSYLGPGLANIITGSVSVEMVFGLPGIGTLLVNGALSRDYTVVMGLVILTCTLMIIANLIVDILYTFLDPRVSY